MPSFFLGTSMGSAIQLCANQLSFKPSSSQTAGNQSPFAFQPRIVTANPHSQSTQLYQHQSPLILPANFNGTILYQPTIYLNTNKKLSDLVNLQKSFRHIVPKSTPTSSNNVSTSPIISNTQANNKLTKKTHTKSWTIHFLMYKIMCLFLNESINCFEMKNVKLYFNINLKESHLYFNYNLNKEFSCIFL